MPRKDDDPAVAREFSQVVSGTQGYPQTDLRFLLRRAALIGFKSEFVAPTRAAMTDEAISSPDYCTAGTDLEQNAKRNSNVVRNEKSTIAQHSQFAL